MRRFTKTEEKEQIEQKDKRKETYVRSKSLKLWYQMLWNPQEMDLTTLLKNKTFRSHNWKPQNRFENQPKESKNRITLSIKYLKARSLLEIRITPQAWLIKSSLNDSQHAT